MLSSLTFLHNDLDFKKFLMPKVRKTKGKKINVKKEFVFLCSCCATLFVLLIAGYNFKAYLNVQKVLGTETATESSNYEEKVFWLNFLKANPRYLDGWIELTKIDIANGDVQGAKENLKKAFEINPNSEKLKSLEDFLGK